MLFGVECNRHDVSAPIRESCLDPLGAEKVLFELPKLTSRGRFDTFCHHISTARRTFYRGREGGCPFLRDKPGFCNSNNFC